MIALIIVIALLTAAVIILVFQRNRARNQAPFVELAERYEQLTILADERSRLELKVQQLTAELNAKDAAVEGELERIAAESVRQINEHKHRLDLEFEQKKRTDRSVSNVRSRGALVAKVAEHMAPYLPGFAFNPKDARHFGEIFDFLIFDGLEAGGPVTVVFLEIKTTTSGRTRRVTNPRERLLRDAIKNGRVRYEMWQPDAVPLDALAGTEEVHAIAAPGGTPADADSD